MKGSSKRGWKEAQREGDFTDNSMCPSFILSPESTHGVKAIQKQVAHCGNHSAPFMASSKLETVKIRPKWELHIDPHSLPHVEWRLSKQTSGSFLIPHMQVSHQGYNNVGPNEKLTLIPSLSLSLSLSPSRGVKVIYPKKRLMRQWLCPF